MGATHSFVSSYLDLMRTAYHFVVVLLMPFLAPIWVKHMSSPAGMLMTSTLLRILVVSSSVSAPTIVKYMAYATEMLENPAR